MQLCASLGKNVEQKFVGHRLQSLWERTEEKSSQKVFKKRLLSGLFAKNSYEKAMQREWLCLPDNLRSPKILERQRLPTNVKSNLRPSYSVRNIQESTKCFTGSCVRKNSIFGNTCVLEIAAGLLTCSRRSRVESVAHVRI